MTPNRPCRTCGALFDTTVSHTGTPATRPRWYCTITCRLAEGHRIARVRRDHERSTRADRENPPT